MEGSLAPHTLVSLSQPRVGQRPVASVSPVAGGELRGSGCDDRDIFCPRLFQTIKETCKLMASLGAPDLTEEAIKVLNNNTIFNAEPELVGTYGGHSELSRQASQLYDRTGRHAALSRGCSPPHCPPH